MRHTRLPAPITRAAAFRGDRADPFLMPPIRITFGAVLAVNLGRLAILILKTMIRHLIAVIAVTVIVTAWVLLGPTRMIVATIAVVAALGLWALIGPVTFRRFVGDPAARAWWRWWRYRRIWAAVMPACGLTVRYQDSEFVPRLRKINIGDCGDRLLVDLVSGQAPEVWEKQCDALAHSFRSMTAVVRVEKPGRIWLELVRTDPLVTPITALEPPELVDFTAITVGRCADGQPWTIQLLGSHLLIGGATGSGKGSVSWSLIRALQPACAAGVAELWAVDPKGGMEFAFGAPLFERLAYRHTGDMLQLLDDAVAVMKHRQDRLLGVTRLHEPTIGDPLLVVIVDELAALVAYVDRDTKRRASDALQLLLSQGRAVGVVVVAALQDPGKDVLPFRDLFPTRVALRLVEDVQVDMILGRGARERGARCDQIPASLPGVGYVQLDGVREPVRVRAAYVSDDDIADMSDPELNPCKVLAELELGRPFGGDLR